MKLSSFLLSLSFVILPTTHFYSFNPPSPHPISSISVTPNALDVWIDNLADAECRSCQANYKIVDTNGFYSYGQFQFQLATFQENYNKYFASSSPITIADSRILIDNYTLQRRLVRTMIEHNPDAWKNWYNSVMYHPGLGKPPIL